MQNDQTIFKTAWWAADLGKHRPCDSTYCLFPYESLPPLDISLFKGEFQWLVPLDEQTDKKMAVHRHKLEEKLKKRLETLTVQVSQLGLTLPPAFVKFMASPTLQDRVPSCTACYFDLPDEIIKCALGDDGYFIRFMNDQQDVLLWYLYLDRKGNHSVIVSQLDFEDEEGLMQWAKQAKLNLSEMTERYAALCAPDFESFIYRIWIENNIWFALNEGSGTLTSAQQAYLEAYAK